MRIKNVADERCCLRCSKPFVPSWKRRNQKLCSLKCQRLFSFRRTPEQNRELSIRTAAKRGDTLRGKGLNKAYRKLNGRHEHRVVMEQIIGRPLRKGEVVHHIDGNKLNNRPENLELLDSQGIHINMHRNELVAARFKKGGNNVPGE